MKRNILSTVIASLVLTACGEGNAPSVASLSPEPSPDLSAPKVTVYDELREVIGDTDSLMFPTSIYDIPADPSNPITPEKVELGKFLFHETGATKGNTELVDTWSCATCHSAKFGFRDAIRQSIGEGGLGFGENRVLAYDGIDSDSPPISTPTSLNLAYQEVTLWNGMAGNQIGGAINGVLPEEVLAPEGTPKTNNLFQLGGAETQVLFANGAHRKSLGLADGIVRTNETYNHMLDLAFPEGYDNQLVAVAKAIAAYERTKLATEAPFQAWLAGDDSAMTEQQAAGAKLFFGEAGCSGCHQGPALATDVGSSDEDTFMAIGFADLDYNNTIVGMIDDATRKGRGGFTGNDWDNYRFKVPTLYNLADVNFYGHGGSFTSVREVIEYKNAAIPQADIPAEYLDYRFVPLNLTEEQITDLTAFVEEALRDPNLERYQPAALPTGNCIINADDQSKIDLGCNN